MRILEITKNTYYSFENLFSKPMSLMKKYYIRKMYDLDINDLNLYEYENYHTSGPYVTIPKSVRKTYNKRIKSLNIDSKGIPQFMYREKLNYNPIQIIQFGIEEYGYYIDNKNHKHLENALLIGEWAIDNIDSNNGCWNFEFNFFHPLIEYEIEGPWCSALGQGQGISLMCRLYSIDQKEVYKETVELALKPFFLTVEEGGVLEHFQEMIFFEEYPTRPATYTLNGFIYSIFGLYDAYKIFGLIEAKQLFDEAILTLKKVLPLYDDSRLSYYDLSHFTGSPRKTVQNSKYHILHIKLLQALISIEPDDTFEFYIKRWKQLL